MTRWVPAKHQGGRERVAAMRARRLVAVATVATLGVLSLGACTRSAPDVAVYVDDSRYTVKRVDAIHDELQKAYADTVRQAAAKAGATPTPEQLESNLTRQDVVNLLVSMELGQRVAKERGIQVEDQFKVEELGEGLRIPNTEYAKLAADWYDLYMALVQQLPPAELSDQSLMAVYDALVDAEALRPGASVSEVRQMFGDGEFVQSASAVSAALAAEAEKADASINPHFRPVAVPALAPNQGMWFPYALPYVDKDGPVIDITRSEPVPADL